MVAALIFQEEPIAGRFEGLDVKSAICNADQLENHRGLQVGADGSRLARSACHVRG
jgi:hypothetical protein